MRRLMLASLIAAMLTGCGSSPTAPHVAKATTAKPAATAAKSAVAPTVALVPTVSVASTAVAPATEISSSQDAAVKLVAADSNVEAIELLIQDGAGYYHLEGWFGDMVTAVKNAWTRIKLSFQVKSALKASFDKAYDLHEGEIDAISKNRTIPVTKTSTLADGEQDIKQTWTYTDNGVTTGVITDRIVDQDGVTQTLSVTTSATDKSGTKTDLSRIRTLQGTDGTYKVATKMVVTDKAGKATTQEWLKTVTADGAETLTGYILHPDGYRTDLTGTRDAKGKISVKIASVAPGASN